MNPKDGQELALMLNECWSELNEMRVHEAKQDLIKAMRFLHILRGSPVPTYTWSASLSVSDKLKRCVKAKSK